MSLYWPGPRKTFFSLWLCQLMVSLSQVSLFQWDDFHMSRIIKQFGRFSISLKLLNNCNSNAVYVTFGNQCSLHALYKKSICPSPLTFPHPTHNAHRLCPACGGQGERIFQKNGRAGWSITLLIFPPTKQTWRRKKINEFLWKSMI